VHSNYIPPFLTAAILYFILCFPLATFARRWEAKNKEAY
ncbi:amino acid ABC transporter permease, partial [Streptococcus pyogenes]